MKWVTRPNIRVNRTATAWLIRRFIDPDPFFLFVEAERVAEVERREGAIGFDAPGAAYPYKDAKERCSFEALVEAYCPNDGVLRDLARIIRGADFPEEISLTPESAGLQAISHGFPAVAKDDQETIEKATFLYDSLYASLKARIKATKQDRASN